MIRWSHDLFTMDADWLRTVLNYGLPAVVYVCVGHALAARIRRIQGDTQPPAP
ncbi:hypothetical protein OG301_02560 [Streptomyces platensis]|uniref:hypothetical protein n=1 Tax=Streptomyces platensis TaxID=58346 RepID=UPI002E81B258|nr:hypothetical protein [Streptomyces platensis]WTI50355.1 hypothetical protein OG301_02560 [Streptomyces platensis]WUB85101.1 hypothetical protein OG424_35725 [Streptomyces platensis]